MTVAIIGAYQCDDSGRRIARLPIAGMTLVERQARAAAAAGARPVYLLGEGDDVMLAEIVGRLTRDGVDAHALDDLSAASDRIALDTPVLLLADGCLADPALLERLADAPVPSIATVADGEGRERYERIDAVARWAGAALIDGKRVNETAAMLGSWDPVSTLLRRTVQEEAPRIDVGDRPPLLAAGPADTIPVERALYDATARDPADWIERFGLLPLENKALPYLLAQRVDPGVLADGASIFAIVAALCAIAGWRWPALLALLLVAPLAGMAERMWRIQGRVSRRVTPHRLARLAGGGIALAAFAVHHAIDTGQWGWALVAALLAGSLFLLDEERGAAPPMWLPRPSTMAWAMLPFALVGQWGAGLAALTAWSVGGFVTMLRRRRADRDAPSM